MNVSFVKKMDVQILGGMWQTTQNLYTNPYGVAHPAIMHLRSTNTNNNHSWFHSRKPCMDDVGNPGSVNAR